MDDAMVTGRMSQQKKEAGARVLGRFGLNASQAINLLYSRLIDEQDASFLLGEQPAITATEWQKAATFCDSLIDPRTSRFDSMSKAEIKRERLASKGLVEAHGA